MEFNPDGSLKISGTLARNKEENTNRLRTQRCIKIKKELISTYPPKKCLLKITLSEVLNDNRFIDYIYSEFNQRSPVPTKLIKIDEKNYEIEVGTDFKRCSDCTRLINMYRSQMDGNLIEDKGSCTFEQNRNFSYEDYF